MTDDPYHWPPELMDLLIDTIPLLCRSKPDVLMFFRGCGVPAALTADLRAQVERDRNSINKYAIARITLARINELNDAGLGYRREVVKRVAEFDDFTTCWESGRLKAQGLVARIREVVDVKDSFTRMRQERDTERDARMRTQREEIAARQRRREERSKLRGRLAALGSMPSPHQRGKAFEAVFNDLFAVDGLSVRDAFTVNDEDGRVCEQIDGLIALGTQLYLAEVKWYAEPLGVDSISRHLVRVHSRAGAHALIVSASGFSKPAIDECQRALAQRVVVLAEVPELLLLLEEPEASLAAWLQAKTISAVVDRQPLFRPGLAVAQTAS